MQRKLKPISEVIEMACKGFFPIKSDIYFQETIYEFKYINKKRTNLIYCNENESNKLDFRLDDDGILQYIEYIDSEFDDDDEHIIFNIDWSELQKIANNDYGLF